MTKLTEEAKDFAYGLAEEIRDQLDSAETDSASATADDDGRPDAFQFAAILGHATIQMSARYTYATNHGLRRAMESLTAKETGVAEKLTTQFTHNLAPVN